MVLETPLAFIQRPRSKKQLMTIYIEAKSLFFGFSGSIVKIFLYVEEIRKQTKDLDIAVQNIQVNQL